MTFPPLITSRLIHPLRCRLNRWHREVDRIAKRLRETEFAPLDRLYSIQERKLRHLCNNAANGSPYYKKIFAQAGVDPRLITLDMLSKLPALERSTVRNNRENILNRSYPKSRIVQNATGGSSGEPLLFYRSQKDLCFAAAILLQEMTWCGMRPGYPHVKLWGAPTDVQTATTGLKSRLWNYLYNRRVIDAFDAGPALFEKEYRKFIKTPPRLLESYSNILYEFACYLETMAKGPLDLPAVISSSGVLYDFQRNVIQRALSSNIFNRYGCRELGNIAQECACHEGLHIHMERHIVEIVNTDQNGIGDILVTDLENQAFPFIRYKIGDKGGLSDSRCACGRKSLMFKSIIGRNLDIIRTSSGRLISGELFPHLFKDYPQIILGQVIQNTIDHIELRLKLQAEATAADIEPLIQKIIDVSRNELKITVNTEKDFVVNPTGKYRPVISRLISS